MDNPDTLTTLDTQDTGQINVRENRRDSQYYNFYISYLTVDNSQSILQLLYTLLDVKQQSVNITTVIYLTWRWTTVSQ
jgi:hypothetical protein